jgi:hypothetical protein
MISFLRDLFIQHGLGVRRLRCAYGYVTTPSVGCAARHPSTEGEFYVSRCVCFALCVLACHVFSLFVFFTP